MFRYNGHDQSVENVDDVDLKMEDRNNNNGEAEDDDYMSFKFLPRTVDKKEKKKPTSTPASTPPASLTTKLSHSNKGMQLLLKMGYKEGQALGKSNKGIVEPLEIHFHTGRKGLGSTSLKANDLEVEPKSSNNKANPDEFRILTGNKQALKFIKFDIDKCRRMCFQLDQQADATSHFHFWPLLHQPPLSDTPSSLLRDVSIAAEEENEIELHPESIAFEALEPTEQLSCLLDYLRTTYFYCLYCGCSYTSREDLLDGCPGTSRDDHDEM